MFRLSALLPSRFFAAARLSSEGSRSTRSVRSALLNTVSRTIIMESPRKTTGDSGIACRPASFHSRSIEAQQDQKDLRGMDGSASEYPHQSHVGRAREGGQTAKFQMKNDCLLALHRGDITKWSVDGKTDAIVNAANTRMLGGGGVDGAIHRAAGPDLYQACLKLPLQGKNIRCQTGDAVITSGFRLPVSKVIHTAGPRYHDDEKPETLLENCYKNSLFLAEKSGIKYLAFPAISCGIYGYPYDNAAEIAINTIGKHSDSLKEVHFVLFEEESWSEWLEKARTSFQRIQE